MDIHSRGIQWRRCKYYFYYYLPQSQTHVSWMMNRNRSDVHSILSISYFRKLIALFNSTLVFGKAGWWEPSSHTACGVNVSDTSPVAALGFSHWTNPLSNQDAMCEGILRVIDPLSGKKVIVAVIDKCQDCEEEDVKLSPGAFQQLRKLDEGSFIVNWEFLK